MRPLRRPAPDGQRNAATVVISLVLLTALTAALAVRAGAMPIGEETDQVEFDAGDVGAGGGPTDGSSEQADAGQPADDSQGKDDRGGEEPQDPAGGPANVGAGVAAQPPAAAPGPEPAGGEPAPAAQPPPGDQGQQPAGMASIGSADQEAALERLKYEFSQSPSLVKTYLGWYHKDPQMAMTAATADRRIGNAQAAIFGALDGVPVDHPVRTEFDLQASDVRRATWDLRKALHTAGSGGLSAAQAAAAAGPLQDLEAAQAQVEQIARKRGNKKVLNDAPGAVTTVNNQLDHVYAAFGTTREQVAAARKAAQTGGEPTVNFQLHHPQPGTSVLPGGAPTPAGPNLLTTPPANSNWRLLNPTGPPKAQPATPTLLGGSPLDAATRELLTDHTPPLSGWATGAQLLTATTDLQTTIQATTVNPTTNTSPYVRIGDGAPLRNATIPFLLTTGGAILSGAIWLLTEAACLGINLRAPGACIP